MGRPQAALLFLISAAFVAMGAFILWRGDPGDRAAGAACAAFFGGCALVSIGELLPRRIPEPDAAGVVVLGPDAGRMLALICAGLLMAGGSYMIGRLAAAGGAQVMSWIGWAGTVLFGLAAPVGALRLLRKRKLWRLDPEGVTKIGGWTLRWRDISDVAPFVHAGQAWIGLETAPDAPRGVMERVNEVFSFPPFAMSAHGLALGPDDLLTLVMAYWTRHRGW